MVRYRRNRLEGGTYFFTVALADRRATLLVDHILALRAAFRVARQERPYVIEFNARFGDPETQPLLVRLHNDLLPLLEGAARGHLGTLQAEYLTDAAVCVVMASEGYPGAYAVGTPIVGVEESERLENTWVFHAGTDIQDGRLVTNGGRVLGVTTRAASLASAITHAYHAVARIQWPGAHYRRDIGHRALHRVPA